MKYLIFFVVAVFTFGCMSSSTPVDDRNSNLTQGSVQMNLVVGKTTKKQVLETFGAPNITTRESSGNEVWTYQRAGQVKQTTGSSGGFSILFLGQQFSNSGFASSSRMMTLIIEFNSKDVVKDFSSRTSNF